jgi:CheY-like chemotaxis protein/CHASE3 domain sensor protein
MLSEAHGRKLLARRLAIAIATPVILLVLLGVLLGRQILQMSEQARWVDHTDEVISVANDLFRQIIDQETGLRGYLLTQDRAFLEPFDRARPRTGFARLHALVAYSPLEQARFDEARDRYETWLATATEALDESKLDVASRPEIFRERKRRMDAVRESLGAAIAFEEELRHSRVAAWADGTETTKVSFVGALAASALMLAFLSRHQLASIASTFNLTLVAERKAREATEAEGWVRAGHARLADALQGERSVEQLGANALARLAEYVGADVGAFFTRERGAWRRRAGYALDSPTAGPDSFADGEGVIGRVAAGGELLHLREVPADFLKVRSGTGEASPAELVVLPAQVDGTTNAVLELGFLRAVDARTLELLGRIGGSLALAVRSSDYKQQLRELLGESQQQTEALQTQQEELRVANEELGAQTTALLITQKKLEKQQTAVEQTNEDLVEQSRLLEQKNQELADSHTEIASRSRDVARASAFKSEFLSNMSHELRTPLNSSLILSKLLADNREGNLTAEQVKFAETIYSAGNELLALINDILDLSKIEAGKMDIRIASATLERVREAMLRTFGPVAKEKGLRFGVTLTATAPAAFETDAARLEQILKNLLSNALKFTESGGVMMEVSASEERLAFAVRDTGIGIPVAQHGAIFEAFRQADGTTNRRFGGTGLGLSISRELARLLGGEIDVTSEPGHGSTFTLSLPRAQAGAAALGARPASRPPPVTPPPAAASSPLPGDGDGDEPVEPGRRTVLLIEDDASFVRILSDVAREADFRCLVATTAEQGFRLAKKHAPTGIVLDMKLPDHTGLYVLDRLKREPSTRHIPVHVISASDFVETALAMGAAAYLQKPVQREQLVEAFRALEAKSTHRIRRVLVVDDDEAMRDCVASLLGRSDVEVTKAASVSDALAALRAQTFDCVVTDLAMPGQSGYELLETLATEEPYSVPPVIIYTGCALTSEQEQQLRRYSSSIIIKGARSPERLLDEVTLFLHQVESDLAPAQRRLLQQARHREAVFEGRTILVVEDDVRNVFALTSLLEPKGARVTIARNGREALLALQKEPGIDLVLMDLMMPEMDGLEATREIRKEPRWARLPIIALTAKAMRDDQERCIAAGASDYLAKPLDAEMLFSLLRVWMPKT